MSPTTASAEQAFQLLLVWIGPLQRIADPHWGGWLVIEPATTPVKGTDVWTTIGGAIVKVPTILPALLKTLIPSFAAGEVGHAWATGVSLVARPGSRPVLSATDPRSTDA